MAGQSGEAGWASSDFLVPIDDLESHLKSPGRGKPVKLPPDISKKPGMLTRTPSGPLPRRFHVETAGTRPTAGLKDTTSFPAGHTSWIATPTQIRLVSHGDRVRRKLVIVGDGACGKTCALDSFSKGSFPDMVYVPTVSNNYLSDIEVDGHRVELDLWDTAGREDHDRLRLLSYPDSNVVVISYSIDSAESLENACSKWISETAWFCPGVPSILVGLKEDLRHGPWTVEYLAKTRQAPVTYQQGLAAAKHIGAAVYVECSAKTGDGIRSTFEVATKLGLYGSNWFRGNMSSRKRCKGGCDVM